MGSSGRVISSTPSGSAGGVLGGTYPSPSFAADMATQAELNAAVAPVVTEGAHTANYVLVIGDAGTVVAMNLAGPNTLTVPPNTDVPFPVGTVLEVFQPGAGQTTITPGVGVSVRSSGAKLKLSGQYASASLRQRATDEWVAAGDLST